MIHCHNHTDLGSNIRLTDSIIKVPQLIKRAVELGNQGVAITDHESVCAHVDALKEVKKGKENGTIPKDFKLILGNEVYLVDDLSYVPGKTKFWHFILLAKDEIGHWQLRNLSSIAWDNSFYTGKMERVPLLKEQLRAVVEENPGHLIACSACLGSELDGYLLQGNFKEALNFIGWCIEVFGRENYFMEMQPSDSEDQITANEGIYKISQAYHIPYVITCDSHYLKKEDRIFHEAFLKSKEEEREVDEFYATTYMLDENEIHSYMDDVIGSEAVDVGLQHTLLIGSMIEEYDLAHDVIVPDAEIPEFELQHIFQNYYDEYPYIAKYANSDNIYDRYLLYLIEKGFMEKGYYEGISPKDFYERINRIEVELSEMWKVTQKIKTSISSYYISTLDIINTMWNEGDSLVGIARGSVTGMYTMYLIGLIQMNPLQWGLPYWRHISWQKAELSDLKKSACIVIYMPKCGELRNLRCAQVLTVSVK